MSARERRMDPTDVETVEIYLRVERKDIAYIKFLIEGHEGLGIVRTLNRHAAIIVVLVTKDFERTARDLFEALRATVTCVEIPRPPEATTDWLLRADADDETL